MADSFDRALRGAIRARGQSLERLHVKLAERGIHVSMASLGNWQRGRCRPERSQSLRAVRALEEILDLAPYSLAVLLGPRRPRGRWVRTVHGGPSYRDVCEVHDDGPEATFDQRWFRFPAHTYLLRVQFEPDTLPTRCHRTWQPNVSAPSADVQELRLSGWHTVRVADLEVRPGVHGIRWEWD
ncbi:helix-turn-helix domain-containing protein [Actinomadura soli]|nr:hypothetical protein [Actinomadura soli]